MANGKVSVEDARRESVLEFCLRLAGQRQPHTALLEGLDMTREIVAARASVAARKPLAKEVS